jgi:hypothetical protein
VSGGQSTTPRPHPKDVAPSTSSSWGESMAAYAPDMSRVVAYMPVMSEYMPDGSGAVGAASAAVMKQAGEYMPNMSAIAADGSGAVGAAAQRMVDMMSSGEADSEAQKQTIKDMENWTDEDLQEFVLYTRPDLNLCRQSSRELHAIHRKTGEWLGCGHQQCNTIRKFPLLEARETAKDTSEEALSLEEKATLKHLGWWVTKEELERYVAVSRINSFLNRTIAKTDAIGGGKRRTKKRRTKKRRSKKARTKKRKSKKRKSKKRTYRRY